MTLTSLQLAMPQRAATFVAKAGEVWQWFGFCWALDDCVKGQQRCLKLKSLEQLNFALSLSWSSPSSAT